MKLIMEDVMGQFIITLLFFSIALLVFWGALKFSKFKGEGHEECDDEDSSILKNWV